MVNCLSGNATDCAVCSGDRCNIEIFPENRRRCHRCNSKDEPTCESAPDAASVCPFFSDVEFCSAKIVNGYTYRGCSSEFQCDETDKQYCRMCKGADNCNTIDLASVHIGYPGKWQDVPINCYTCVGSECAGSATGVVLKCEGNKQQNCGTVFDANGNVVQRGCSNAIYEGTYGEYCDQNPDHCKFCKSNGCNFANNLFDFVDCLQCEGTENKDCVSNVNAITRTRTCHKSCMTGLYPRTDDVNAAYELSRGCLDDLDLDDREACEKGNMEYCVPCTTAVCNKASIPATRLRCNICDGEDECVRPTSQVCNAYREHDQCYTLFDHSGEAFEESNKVVRMGCASDLDTAELAASRREMLLCDGENCNVEANYPTGTGCSYCNSATNENCVSNPSSVGGVGCTDLPYTQCFTRVDQSTGLTHRGCLSDLDDAVFDDCLSGSSTNCTTCDANNCNVDIFPENRRRCHRCDSLSEPACEGSPAAYASVCPLYKEADSCVTKIEGDRTLRGCASDFTCDANSTSTCRICETDNCNTVNLLVGYVGEPGRWQDLPLNCYACEGAECAAGKTVHRCEGNNLQNCVTVFGEDNTVQSRGCSDTVEATHADYCEEYPDKCVACKSSGCNDANSFSDLVDCYFCDSATSNACSINFATTSRTRKCHGSCMVALYPRSSAEDTAYEMSRSCLDDMDLDDRERCAAGDFSYCQSCTGARCNSGALPAERHECWKCVGDDCESPKVQQCSAYHPNDQCYILFDAESSIVGMGCRSEYETVVVTELIKLKQLLLCDGKNCNAQSTVPTPKTCSVCNSQEDSRCATNPNLVGYSERCAAVPYTECYTRVDENGHTRRGCLAALDSDTFYGCLTNADGLCETCTGDKCNEIDVFPAGRLSCHQCSSASDPLCSTAPNSNQVCPVYNARDTCVSNLRNGVTTRGCSSSMRCDNESDKHSCRVCSSSGCNTVDMEKIKDNGEPGRWQGVPINCYSCVGAEACASRGLIGVCLNDPFQNCMTVFNAEGVVTQRGCSDTVEAANQAYCQANPEKCMACNSNGCNVATTLTDYVECLACDTDTNGNCVSDVATISKTRSCYKHCMTAMYPRDEEADPAYGLSRSCYDDMDLNDRDACETGDKEHCQVCSTAKCNSDAMPQTPRLSCYICADDGCQDPKATTCPTYRAEDKCYTRFDEQRSIIAMGCRSEFSNSEADYLLRQKRLLLCEDDNCNGFDALPSSQSCTLCSSRTDVSCATDPTAVTSVTTCSAMPYTECYSRVLTDGATERGCLSNLYDDEFLGCLNGTSSTCLACVGNKCNSDLYPSGRTSCHICDSSTDASCETNPNHLSICPLYEAADTCVTSYLNDITYRGCGSSLVCDITNSHGCSICTGDGCNTINLAEKQDDNFGKWQDLPLRCLTCAGNDCDATETTLTQTCENNNEQDCVTVFDASGKVVRRGCADAVEADYGSYCAATDDACYNCKSNECNTATAKSQYVDCVYCDSYKSLDCVWNPLSASHKTRKCQGGCMSALYVSVDIATSPAYDLIRTCLNDKETADQTTCSAGSDDSCKACTTANCNVDDMPADRHHCYICDGDDCEDPMPKVCPLYKADDQCYIWFDESNSISEMGCLSSFRNQNIENILKTKRVWVCDGENCNTLQKLPTPQKCAVCDSNDNVNCATNALEIGTFDTCSQMPYTSCYSRVASDGSTARGCLSELPGDDFVGCLLETDENCGVCTGDGCNREVFPADRQQCYTCTSEDDNSCESTPTRLLPCPTVSDGESCTTSLQQNVTLRGCSSELPCDVNATCRVCFGNGCNTIDLANKVDDGNHGLWQSLPLRCHTCDGEHCEASLGPAIACANNDKQDCMTVFDGAGEVIQRGCEDAVETYQDRYCRENPELCFKCKSNECNAAWSLSEYVQCAYCSSANNSACAVDPENGAFATRACYQECMVAMKGADVIRSCLDDKELFVQHVCRSNESGKECASCNTNECNTFIYPSDRLKCHVCSGSTCGSSNVAQYCQLYDENDFCFAKYENNRIDIMGCGSSQNSSDIAEWTEQNQLYRCEGNECNEWNKLPADSVCISCDSSKTANCAQDASQVQTTEVCQAPSNECLTRIDSAGNTLRGCSSSLSQAEQNSCVGAGTCAICTGEKCNVQIFPTNRRKCHICNSVADDNCETDPDALHICPIYAANDQCVTKNTDNYIERGCATQLTCDVGDEEHCQICGTDGCNTADLTDAAVLAAGSLMLTMLLAFVATVALNRH